MTSNLNSQIRPLWRRWEPPLQHLHDQGRAEDIIRNTLRRWLLNRMIRVASALLLKTKVKLWYKTLWYTYIEEGKDMDTRNPWRIYTKCNTKTKVPKKQASARHLEIYLYSSMMHLKNQLLPLFGKSFCEESGGGSCQTVSENEVNFEFWGRMHRPCVRVCMRLRWSINASVQWIPVNRSTDNRSTRSTTLLV